MPLSTLLKQKTLLNDSLTPGFANVICYQAVTHRAILAVPICAALL